MGPEMAHDNRQAETFAENPGEPRVKSPMEIFAASLLHLLCVYILTAFTQKSLMWVFLRYTVTWHNEMQLNLISLYVILCAALTVYTVATDRKPYTPLHFPWLQITRSVILGAIFLILAIPQQSEASSDCWDTLDPYSLLSCELCPGCRH